MDIHNKIVFRRLFKDNDTLTKRIQKSKGEELKTAINEISEATGISELFITTHIQEIRNMSYSTN